MSSVERYGRLSEVVPRTSSSRAVAALIRSLGDLDQNIAVALQDVDVSMRIMERRAEAEIAQSRADQRRRW